MTTAEAKAIFAKFSHNLRVQTIESRLKKLIQAKNDGQIFLSLDDNDIRQRFAFIIAHIYGPNIAKLVLELFSDEKKTTYYITSTNDALIQAARSNSQYSDKTLTSLIEDGTIGIGWKNYECLLQAAKNGSYQAFRVFHNLIPTIDLSVRDNEVALEIMSIKNKDGMYSHNAKLIWKDFFENNQNVIKKAVELGQSSLVPDSVKDIFMF